jgi:hypothetical protein
MPSLPLSVCLFKLGCQRSPLLLHLTVIWGVLVTFTDWVGLKITLNVNKLVRTMFSDIDKSSTLFPLLIWQAIMIAIVQYLFLHKLKSFVKMLDRYIIVRFRSILTNGLHERYISNLLAYNEVFQGWYKICYVSLVTRGSRSMWQRWSTIGSCFYRAYSSRH